MTETGKIKEINGKIVTIVSDESCKKNLEDSCFGCMSMECKNRTANDPLLGCFTAENKNALQLEKGQNIEIEARRRALLVQVIVAFLPPVLGFAASYFLIRILFPQTGKEASAAIGIIFLFLTAFILYHARRKKPQKEIYIVKRIIT